MLTESNVVKIMTIGKGGKYIKGSTERCEGGEHVRRLDLRGKARGDAIERKMGDMIKHCGLRTEIINVCCGESMATERLNGEESGRKEQLRDMIKTDAA